LDPRDERAQYDAGITYQRLHRYDEAERYLKRHLALGPANSVGYRRLAVLQLMRDGDTAAARATIANAGYGIILGFDNIVGSIELHRLWCGDCKAAAREHLNRSGQPEPDPLGPWHPYMTTGRLHRLSGDDILARAYLDSAVRVAEAQIQSALRKDPHAHQDLAVVLALLGRTNEAINAAREAVRLDPTSRNALDGPGRLTTLAEILAIFGDEQAALEQLETLFSIPSHYTVPFVRVYPVWDRFRDNPHFQALLNKYQNN
jgi:tetratricopeptide (TPR) repeat protein